MIPTLLHCRCGRRVYYLIAAALLALATACSPAAPPEAADGPTDYVLTVALGADDTVAEAERRYDGTAIAGRDGSYAVLEVAAGPALHSLTLDPGDGSGDPAVVLEADADLFRAAGSVGMNGRSTLWAGGRSTLWAGGRSTLWAGGRSLLWAGGEFSWLPENTALWQQIDLQQGHELAPNLGYGVTVAVIDTGVDLAHPALSEALAPSEQWWDFHGDDAVPQEEGVLGVGGYGHGTNVAGIVRQLAPRATLLPLRVLGPDGSGSVADVVAAVHYAMEQGADVINLSLGSTERVEALEPVIREAEERGVFVVASSGNTGDERVTYPAADLRVERLQFAVTSVDALDRKSSFATYGREIALAAPGETVYGPAPELQMAAWSGTSMAAPMVVGAIALALGEANTATVSDKDFRVLADKLHAATADLYNNDLNEAYKDLLGKGRLDVHQFLLDALN